MTYWQNGIDIASPAILQMMQRGMGDTLANAPLRFAPFDGVAFSETVGWRATDVRSIFREAIRFKRLPLLLRPFGLFPDPDPRKPGKGRWSAVARLERA